MVVTLAVEKRDPNGASAHAVRREGNVPGVVYGPHKEATPISINGRVFEKVFRTAGESSIVSLTGLGEAVPTLIHEVDLDPLTSVPRHVDFYAVTKGEKVEIKIPLTFVGESPAVKAGANLVKVFHEIEIKADPMNLPHEIEVDLTKLAVIGDQIHAKDLPIPADVELMTGADEVIALLQEVVEEKIEEVAPADLSSIEVEKKGKEEAEGASAEGEAPAAK